MNFVKILPKAEIAKLIARDSSAYPAFTHYFTKWQAFITPLSGTVYEDDHFEQMFFEFETRYFASLPPKAELVMNKVLSQIIRLGGAMDYMEDVPQSSEEGSSGCTKEVEEHPKTTVDATREGLTQSQSDMTLQSLLSCPFKPCEDCTGLSELCKDCYYYHRLQNQKRNYMNIYRNTNVREEYMEMWRADPKVKRDYLKAAPLLAKSVYEFTNEDAAKMYEHCIRLTALFDSRPKFNEKKTTGVMHASDESMVNILVNAMRESHQREGFTQSQSDMLLQTSLNSGPFKPCDNCTFRHERIHNQRYNYMGMYRNTNFRKEYMDMWRAEPLVKWAYVTALPLLAKSVHEFTEKDAKEMHMHFTTLNDLVDLRPEFYEKETTGVMRAPKFFEPKESPRPYCEEEGCRNQRGRATFCVACAKNLCYDHAFMGGSRPNCKICKSGICYEHASTKKTVFSEPIFGGGYTSGSLKQLYYCTGCATGENMVEEEYTYMEKIRSEHNLPSYS